ncbi:MAG: hypothetical protein NVS3B20_15940 [Polyangiales bacterium]
MQVPERKVRHVQVPSEDVEDVRAGSEEAARGEGITLTVEELEHWSETGEWPRDRRDSSD